MDYGLRITDYGLRITDYGLRITDYGLRITDYGLRITDYGLRITDYGLRITDYFSTTQVQCQAFRYSVSEASHIPKQQTPQLTFIAELAVFPLEPSCIPLAKRPVFCIPKQQTPDLIFLTELTTKTSRT